MKTFKYLMMVAIALLFTACGGQTKTTDGADEAKAPGVESVESESGAEDWDAVLDTYESYVTEYTEILKKASNGDKEAIDELHNFVEKTQEIQKKLSKGAGSMTPEQVKRLTEISQKMVDASKSFKQ
ncbi:MAG: hypothetical protein ACI3X8_06865 [Alloprevotella sp.]